jgi:hypothetical protein
MFVNKQECLAWAGISSLVEWVRRPGVYPRVEHKQGTWFGKANSQTLDYNLESALGQMV